MAAPNYTATSILQQILRGVSPDDKARTFRPRLPDEAPLPPRVAPAADYSAEGLAKRRELLAGQGIRTQQLAGTGPEIGLEDLAGNIENFVGFARVPVGVIGPLRVNGTCAAGDFYVPLATTEGALAASCQRGAYVISQAGGAAAFCLTESVARAPCFAFENVTEVGLFLAWALPRFDSFQDIVGQTSRHARLVDLKTSIAGKEVYLIFEYTTGDASGQNMVTLATEAICETLLAESPVKPRQWYLEGNMSGDKKATTLSFSYARGKKVLAEVTLPARLVRRVLGTTPEGMARYWEISIMGGIQSGSIGVQGHFANAIAALFMACGQDVACVSEASVGLTRMDVTGAGDLYVSVSLPNMIVGTVGGGTRLPTARECLEMLGCYGEGQARKFAEICAATALAGEVSIIGALAAGDFGKAHAKYGRRKHF